MPLGTVLLLLLPAWVTVARSVTQCGPDKYEKSLGLCCDFCPAGHHVSRECDVNLPTECHPCEAGTFMAYRNRETECLLCIQCREDQEVVTPCSPYSDQRCQCRQGAYYCDSEHCAENCYRCTRCEGATLQPCNATRDAICATEMNLGPGDPNKYWSFLLLLLPVIALFIAFKKRRQIPQWAVSVLKQSSSEQGCHSPRSLQPNETLRTTDPERGPPNVDAPLLQEEPASVVVPTASTHLGPSEDPEGGVDLQVLVAEDEEAPQEEEETKDEEPSDMMYNPIARRPRAPAKASASLESLEQEYGRMFSLKDPNSDDGKSADCLLYHTRIYYEFEHSIPEKDWKTFISLVGLKEHDIEICEHENPGNSMEQRHKMLLRWKDRLGREATVFKLLATLHKMGLQTYLQNIINKLVTEKILVKRAEAPN